MHISLCVCVCVFVQIIMYCLCGHSLSSFRAASQRLRCVVLEFCRIRLVVTTIFVRRIAFFTSFALYFPCRHRAGRHLPISRRLFWFRAPFHVVHQVENFNDVVIKWLGNVFIYAGTLTHCHTPTHTRIHTPMYIKYILPFIQYLRIPH